ncbi:alpha/beta fold hydrolase [Trabulsiella odontotermitis]|uniref:alpha/beta fold hydrolase n=1 Tax=Trabulsiella odontotermitis TaxID=379893 RepID=UPI000A4A0C1C|nr:alpha/beta hydrolase [Trabulsiella odontotermitis]
MKIKTLLAAITATVGLATATLAVSADRIADTQAVRNVVLVHGAFADGSGWRGVYDELTGRGYRVTIVQNPLTSLADDVAATKRVLDRQQGPTILVGHSYGGTVITEAGVDPKVAGLVYVSALAPDVGESTASQFTQIPPPAEFVIDTQRDGFGFINLEKFKTGFAGDTSDADAAFLRDSQVPLNMANFDAKVTHAAWRNKPSWAIIATQDKAIDPRLLHKTAERINARVVEVNASHVLFLTQPKAVAVADAIDNAAQSIKG